MTDLTKAELRWLTRPDDADPRPRGYQAVIGQLSRTVRDYQTYTSDVADALLRASVSEPPQQRRSQAGKVSTSEVPDPALGAIVAVAEAVSRASLRFAHLLAPCGLAECDHAAVDLAGLLVEVGGDVDALEDTADSLASTMATQTGAMRSDVETARRLHRDGAARFDVLVKQLDDPVHVADLVGRMSWLTVQAGRLRGSVAQWVSGTLVRMCACSSRECCPDGCRAPAPRKGEGATCGRCRNRKYQGRRAS